jgi:hypothetical protein
MRIFLSYASEDIDAAERIAAALKASGHSVFFNKTALKSGKKYDDSIRKEIGNAETYIFLISGPGRYTLTELRYAEKKFPNPSGHVLPVMLSSIDWARIPPSCPRLRSLACAATARQKSWLQWLTLGRAGILLAS